VPRPAPAVVQKKVLRAAEQDRPDVQRKRDEWAALLAAPDPARLVFVDETWATTNMTRRYGRAPAGARLVMPVPHGRWKTTTFVAALRAAGLTAPMVGGGAITGDLFVAYAERVPAPVLRPGDVVVLDNLACHTRAGVRAAVEPAGGSVVYLPPYSPDYNPIEQAFAKVKARLRAAEIRTVAGVEDFLGQVLDEFPPGECASYLRHCGYTATDFPKAL
jgi:transposase